MMWIMHTAYHHYRSESYNFNMLFSTYLYLLRLSTFRLSRPIRCHTPNDSCQLLPVLREILADFYPFPLPWFLETVEFGAGEEC